MLVCLFGKTTVRLIVDMADVERVFSDCFEMENIKKVKNNLRID